MKSVGKDIRNSIQGLSNYTQISELLYVLKEKKNIVIALAIISAIGTIANHILYVPSYIAPARIEVLPTKKNLLSKIGTGEFSDYGNDSDGLELTRRLSHLQSETFFLEVARRLIKSNEFPKLNLTVSGELSIWNSKFWKTRFNNSSQTALSNPNYLDMQLGTPKAENIGGLAQLLAGFTTVTTDEQIWITIAVKTYDPTTSMFLANLEADTYSDLSTQKEHTEINELLRFIRDRINEAKTQIQTDEENLIAFKNENSIFSTEQVSQSYTANLGGIETQLSALKMKILENNNLISLFQKKKSLDSNKNTTESTISKYPRQLAKDLDNLRRRKYLIQTQSSGEPIDRIKEIDQKIEAVTNQIRYQIKNTEAGFGQELPITISAIEAKISELENQNEIARAQLASIQLARKQLFDSMSNMPRIEQEFYSRTENLKLEYELLASLKRKLQDIEIKKLAIRAPIRVDGKSHAAPQEVRISIIFRLLFSLIVGAFFGGIVIFLLEASNNTIRHATDLENLDLTLLGNIPHVNSRIGSLIKTNEVNTDLLVCETRPNSPEAMAFKYVREQLKVLQTPRGKPVKSITISGTQQHEGKTFFASNLAISTARLDKKVLLVDCDIRAPRVAKYFQIDNSKGVSTFLESKSLPYQELIVTDRVTNLDILPSGPATPNPTELFGNQKFKKFVQEVSEEYDFIFFDAPPAVYVADAPIIASHSDAVILVTSYRKSTKGGLLMANRKIFQISHRRSYGILNNVPVSAHEFTPYVASVADINQARKAA